MPKTKKTTRRSTRKSGLFGTEGPVPGILVAFAHAGSVTVDRCLVAASFVVGRSSETDLPMSDDKMSKRHFRITRTEDGFWIEDLESTNGTFVNGEPVRGKHPLTSPAVIRCGRSLLVFHADAEPLLDPVPSDCYGIAGRFHTGPMMKELGQTALSSRNILLVGPTGTGKELAARALASMMGGSNGPLSMVTHNAARFANEDEATTTLFGVMKRVFSDVDARQGLIERADGGILFLDEVHNLSERVQRSMLRVIEDGRASRIGEGGSREINVRFVFASNADGPTHGLAHDFFQRLRVIRIPRLAERQADIPAIFDAVLKTALERRGIDRAPVLRLLGGDHYEALLLDGLAQGNVRELIDLSDRIATGIAAGSDPARIVYSAFNERFGGGPLARRMSPEQATRKQDDTSHYDQNKAAIIQAMGECKGNLSAAERLLRSRGIPCSRRWLAIYSKRWGIR